jgi:hypothetical protein
MADMQTRASKATNIDRYEFNNGIPPSVSWMFVSRTPLNDFRTAWALVQFPGGIKPPSEFFPCTRKSAFKALATNLSQ